MDELREMIEDLENVMNIESAIVAKKICKDIVKEKCYNERTTLTDLLECYADDECQGLVFSDYVEWATENEEKAKELMKEHGNEKIKDLFYFIDKEIYESTYNLYDIDFYDIYKLIILHYVLFYGIDYKLDLLADVLESVEYEEDTIQHIIELAEMTKGE